MSTVPAAMMDNVTIKPLRRPRCINVGAQDDCAKRTHQKARAKRHKGQQQRRVFIFQREERLRDVRRVDARKKEIEHLQKVAAGDAEHHAKLRLSGGSPSCRPPYSLFRLFARLAGASDFAERI